MSITLRKRGEFWHARGTVRTGKLTIPVPSFSTGCRGRADAEAAVAGHEASIRAETLGGDRGRQERVTIADCLLVYLQRPGGVPSYDADRVADFNRHIGARPVTDAAAAWHDWLRTRGAKMAPATAARWRAILQAALSAGAEAAGIQAPRLPTVRQPVAEREVYLTAVERDRLLAAYSPNARPVAIVLCFAGLRTQEALRLDWRHVRFGRGEMHLPAAGTKSGRGRTVPMHARVRAELEGLHADAGGPDSGPVFLSARGEPYADTRGKGGNPLRKAHATACRRANIVGFRVHDWRHQWAAQLVMAGCDLVTLMRIGGWATPRMVQRYASVTDAHMGEMIRRVG